MSGLTPRDLLLQPSQHHGPTPPCVKTHFCLETTRGIQFSNLNSQQIQQPSQGESRSESKTLISQMRTYQDTLPSPQRGQRVTVKLGGSQHCHRAHAYWKESVGWQVLSTRRPGEASFTVSQEQEEILTWAGMTPTLLSSNAAFTSLCQDGPLTRCGHACKEGDAAAPRHQCAATASPQVLVRPSSPLGRAELREGPKHRAPRDVPRPRMLLAHTGAPHLTTQ